MATDSPRTGSPYLTFTPSDARRWYLGCPADGPPDDFHVYNMIEATARRLDDLTREELIALLKDVGRVR